MFSVALCGLVTQNATFTKLSDYGTITQFTSITLSVNVQFYISWSSRRDISYSKIIPTRFNTFGISQKKNKGCLIFNRNLVFVVSATVGERKFGKMVIGKGPLCMLASLAFFVQLSLRSFYLKLICTNWPGTMRYCDARKMGNVEDILMKNTLRMYNRGELLLL